MGLQKSLDATVSLVSGYKDSRRNVGTVGTLGELLSKLVGCSGSRCRTVSVTLSDAVGMLGGGWSGSHWSPGKVGGRGGGLLTWSRGGYFQLTNRSLCSVTE